jgi:hypothetical protein
MPNQKRILVNGSLAAGVSRDDFIAWVDQHKVSPGAWDLVQRSILIEPMFKVGESVGVVAFMDCETESEALGFLTGLPVVFERVLEFTRGEGQPRSAFRVSETRCRPGRCRNNP